MAGHTTGVSCRLDRCSSPAVTAAGTTPFSFTKQFAVKRGDEVRSTFTPFGEVRVTFD
ncbi:hypothetical protein [Ramlibacter humi]|uniref:hypothetical protein n=1 Tax=Ramlibacter humi TaxID=2530451 RepID=UPI001431CE3B|nr:hypothetical protein [Ramlibacter humi]